MRVLLLLAMVGCSASAMTRDDVVRPADTSDSSRLGLFGPFTKLGSSCASELPTGAAFTCGQDHRIASMTIPFAKMPAHSVVRYRKPDPNRPPTVAMNNSEVMIDGSHIWLETSCGMCRMMMFSTTVIDLRLIDDQDLATQQTNIGLPASPLLRTAKAWDAATASWDRLNFPSVG